MTASSLLYQEPDIITVLIQGGFLLALNLVNSALDKLVYCGLVGQLFVGIAWGVPGANWLDLNAQLVIQKLGYLGLILLVYEGGLSTSFSVLKANFLFCALVAITGIAVPIGLSFVLLRLADATPLQAFAAGAALCSTSLGTTFTILSTTDLAKTRLGVVLTGAAMMDDVVGLVMVQVIINLGGTSSASSFSPRTVIRPVFVSIGFAAGLFAVCWLIVGPLLRKGLSAATRLPPVLKSFNAAFLVHSCILSGLVAGATHAGTSNLFAAYLAGTLISWFDETSGIASASRPYRAKVASNNHEGSEMTNMQGPTGQTDLIPGSACQDIERSRFANLSDSDRDQSVEKAISNEDAPTGVSVYERFYKEPVNRILKPLFFASIGFSIPITEMFRGDVAWRGIIYTILMMLGKMMTGIWLIRISFSCSSLIDKLKSTPIIRLAFCAAHWKEKRSQPTEGPGSGLDSSRGKLQDQQGPSRTTAESNRSQGSLQRAAPENGPGVETDRAVASLPEPRLPAKPRSLYPAAILGLAMVCRGEIGFFIASVADSNGVFGRSAPDYQDGRSSGEIFLIVTWAITLYTMVGPISVGTLVKRVKKLQRQRGQSSGGADPLGVWGVS